MTSFNFKGKSGFTIIELLVAVGITSLLVTLMLTIVTNVLTGWNRSSGSLSSGNQARTVFDQITRDLQSAIIKNDTTNTWLAATIQQDQTTATGDSTLNDPTMAGSWTAVGVVSLVKPTSANGSFQITGTPVNPVLDLTDYRFGQAGVWLRFFTTPAASNISTDVTTLSAPRAVSYQLIRVKVGGGNQYSYQLFRSETRPGDSSTAKNSTFDAGYDLLMKAATVSYNSVNTSTAGTSNDQNVNSVRQPNASRLLANNVIDFGVRIYGKDSADNQVEVFPVVRDSVTPATTYFVPALAKLPYTYAASGRTDLATATLTVAGMSGGTCVAPYNINTLYPPASGVNTFPVAVDVMVRILTDEGARQIANFELGYIQAPAGVSNNTYWWQLAIANSQVYTRRIEIKSQAF